MSQLMISLQSSIAEYQNPSVPATVFCRSLSQYSLFQHAVRCLRVIAFSVQFVPAYCPMSSCHHFLSTVCSSILSDIFVSSLFQSSLFQHTVRCLRVIAFSAQFVPAYCPMSSCYRFLSTVCSNILSDVFVSSLSQYSLFQHTVRCLHVIAFSVQFVPAYCPMSSCHRFLSTVCSSILSDVFVSSLSQCSLFQHTVRCLCVLRFLSPVYSSILSDVFVSSLSQYSLFQHTVQCLRVVAFSIQFVPAYCPMSSCHRFLSPVCSSILSDLFVSSLSQSSFFQLTVRCLRVIAFSVQFVPAYCAMRSCHRFLSAVCSSIPFDVFVSFVFSVQFIPAYCPMS